MLPTRKNEAEEMCDTVLLLVAQVCARQADYWKSISDGDA